MVELIGAGQPRTGTLTQKEALELLGLGPCYHWVEVLADLDGEVALWDCALEGLAEPGEILADYRSTVDWPGGFFWRQLLDSSPEAKVLLSVRDPERWEPSFRETIVEMCFGESLIHLLSSARARVDPSWRRYLEFVDRMFWSEVGTFPAGHRSGELIEAFVAHNEEVKRTVPPERLLVWEVTDGWEPLCAFLDVPVPDRPLPHANDRATFPRPRYRRRDRDARTVASAAASHDGVSVAPRISGLAVSEPETALTQRDVLTLPKLDGTSSPSGCSIAPRWRREASASRRVTLARTLQGRTPWTEEQLFGSAVQAVERMAVDPAEIGTVVTASLYSLGGPTLAHPSRGALPEWTRRPTSTTSSGSGVRAPCRSCGSPSPRFTIIRARKG